MSELREVERLLYTTEEAASALGVGVTKMKDLISSGEVNSVKIGRLRRIPISSLREYVQVLRLAERIGAP